MGGIEGITEVHSRPQLTKYLSLLGYKTVDTAFSKMAAYKKNLKYKDIRYFRS